MLALRVCLHYAMPVMSTKKRKAPATGVRYSDAQKTEIVNFIKQYNSTNGRGGQSAAAKKFKVTPLTISAWLKAAGVKAPGKKIVKAAKPAKAKKGAGKKGMRYSPEKKQEVLDFVAAYNAKNGRGGQNQAAKKFKLSVLTVSAWLKASGAKKPASKKIVTKVSKATKKAEKAAKGSGDLAAFKAALLKLIQQF